MSASPHDLIASEFIAPVIADIQRGVSLLSDQKFPDPDEAVDLITSLIGQSEEEVRAAIARYLENYKFSSTQVDLPEELALFIMGFGMLIPDEDLAEKGCEDDPHVTALYGLHTQDTKDVRNALSDFHGPVELTLGLVAVFEREEFDVVIVTVDSPDLHALNALLRKLDHTNTFPDYTPHATIAYVKPGMGKKYAGDQTFVGMSAEVDVLTFSNKEGEKTDLALGSWQIGRAAIGNGNNQYKSDNPTKDSPEERVSQQEEETRARAPKYAIGMAMSGAVTVSKVDTIDELFSKTHMSLGMNVRASSRFRINDRRVFWDDIPSMEDYNAVHKKYAPKLQSLDWPDKENPEPINVGELRDMSAQPIALTVADAHLKPTFKAVMRAFRKAQAEVSVSDIERALTGRFAIGNGNNQYKQDNPTKGGRDSVGDLMNVDDLSLADNKALMKQFVERYKSDPNLQGAAAVVKFYASLDQPTGLMVRGIVEQALNGKSLNEIRSDPKVQKLIAERDANRRPEYHTTHEEIKSLVDGASGYYRTVADVKPTETVVFRGVSRMPKGDTFELRGPTAFSANKDVAMTYAGKTLLEIEPGAHMLPVGALGNIKSAAEGNEHATLPAFNHRSDWSIHPLGSAYGYAIDMDSDRELSTAGRFQVVSRGERRIGFTDAKSGKFRLKTVNVIRVKQIGVF